MNSVGRIVRRLHSECKVTSTLKQMLYIKKSQHLKLNAYLLQLSAHVLSNKIDSHLIISTSGYDDVGVHL